MFILLVAACNVDLPEGWEDAEPVDELIQSSCGGDTGGGLPSAYDTGNAAYIEAEGGEDQLLVRYYLAHFRCEQEVEGFYKTSSGAVDLLVQPQDMDPNEVAGCDCLYDVYMQVKPIEACKDCTVSVYRRWDNINDDNAPVLEGQDQTTIRD